MLKTINKLIWQQRRGFMRGFYFALLFLSLQNMAFAEDLNARWASFKDQFISRQGRVIDWQNNSMSHSEGQGYVLLIAEEMNDRAAFDLVLGWSNHNLGEKLRAWSFGFDGKKWGVLDKNNASDADIFHAWALLRAGKKWNNAEYTKAGTEIMHAIREELIDKNNLLLPAKFGFQTENTTRINLSYYVFPALPYFASIDKTHQKTWKALYDNAIKLYLDSLATQENVAQLPPDWLTVDLEGKLKPFTENTLKTDAIYGFEAICIPIYLAWVKDKKALEKLRPFIKRVSSDKSTAQTIDLLNPQWKPAPPIFEGGIGHYAALAKAAKTLGMSNEEKILWQLADDARIKNQGNYYGEVLYLLARIL